MERKAIRSERMYIVLIPAITTFFSTLTTQHILLTTVSIIQPPLSRDNIVSFVRELTQEPRNSRTSTISMKKLTESLATNASISPENAVTVDISRMNMPLRSQLFRAITEKWTDRLTLLPLPTFQTAE